jgi:hypothetical protein
MTSMTHRERVLRPTTGAGSILDLLYSLHRFGGGGL